MEQALGVVAHILVHGCKPVTQRAKGDGSKAQRKAAAADLRAMIDQVDWCALDASKAKTVRAQLVKDCAAPTANKAISAFRGVLKEALVIVRAEGRQRRDAAAGNPAMILALGQLSQDKQDDLSDAIAALKVENVKGKKREHAAGNALELGELMALVATCEDGTLAGVRDAAILGIAYAGGLRRSELVGLKLEHVETKDGAPTGKLFVAKGKGNKERDVFIQNGALKALEDWIDKRGGEPGALFLPIGKGGKITRRWVREDQETKELVHCDSTDDGAMLEGMTAQAWYYILSERTEAAKVRDFSPHDLRRTFAGDMLDNGVDIVTVQKLMGHANTSTTAGYDRRGERAKKDAAKRLHFPYQGRK
jgi:site-specific recombinase XerD